PHERARRGDRLGQRREVEDRLARHRDALGPHHREAAHREVLDELAVARHAREHHRPRDLRGRDRLVERAIHLRELAPDQTPLPALVPPASSSSSVPASPSSVARAPRGHARLSLVWPKGRPVTSGMPSADATSTTTSSADGSGWRASVQSVSAPTPRPASPASLPAARSCWSRRSIL